MRAEASEGPGADDWQSIADAMDPERRFLARSWFPPWGASFLPLERWRAPLRYVVCRAADGCVVAIYPFAPQVIAGLTLLSLGGRYFPFRGFPVDAARREEACEALADHFTRLRHGVGLRLGPTESNDPAVTALLRELRQRGWRAFLDHSSPEFLLDLPATLEEFRRQVGAKRLRKASYYERRMARHGEVRIECHTGLAPEAWPAVVGDLGTIEEGSWLARKGGNRTFAGARNAAFWHAALADPGASDTMRAWILYFDGAATSHVFTIDSGTTRYFLANSYVETVAEHRTGSTLYAHVFRDAIEHGIRLANLGQGDAGYKRQWGARTDRRLEDWYALRPGLLGGLLHALLALKSRLRR